jgi:hypothetical protein
MIRFFTLSWESTCQEIERDGNVVIRGTPELPPAEGYSPIIRSRSRGRRRSFSYLVVVLVLLLGAGIFIAIRLSGNSNRLSLGGVSVAIPAGWHNANLPASQNAAAAEPSLSPPCPHSIFGGAPACQDALSLLGAQGANVEQALHEVSQARFTAMQNYTTSVTVIRDQAMRVAGCPAYMTEWHVTWTSPPDTLEEGIAIRTGIANASTRVVYVFIRFADNVGGSPQNMINAIVSSIQCNE